MPPLTVLLVRTAFLYLAAGVLLGAAMLAARGGLGWAASLRALWPVHAEFLLVGWAVQLALGVAYWILPKFSTGPARGRDGPVLAAWILLNAGLWLSALAGGYATQPVAGLAGRLAELTALALFAVHAWPRVRAFGRTPP